MSIRLQTNDGVLFRVRKEVAYQVGAFADMFRLLGVNADDDEEEEEPIPLSKVNSATLTKVLEWIEHKLEMEASKTGSEKSKKVATESSYLKSVISRPGRLEEHKLTDWEKNYFKIKKSVLFAVILAANFLAIEELMDCACLALSMRMRGRTAEEVRAMFSIKNDLTPEEEQEIEEEIKQIDYADDANQKTEDW